MAWEISEVSSTSSAELLMASIEGLQQPQALRLLADCATYFKNRTHLTAVPDEAEPLLRQLATIAYNKLGSEGLVSENYAGVSQTFVDMPDSLRKELLGFRKVSW